MKKKGISPLIATVLIIGFTIVLAALVIQWGGQLVDRIKGETEVTSDVNLICSAGLSQLSISGDVKQGVGDLITVRIDNSNDQEIAHFLFRITESNDDITVVDSETAGAAVTGPLPLGKFNVGTYTFTATAAEAKQLGVIPKVESSDGKNYACSGKELKKPIKQPQP